MDLNLIEKFIVLAIDYKKGNFVIDTLSLNYGIAGAILLEMSELNKIAVEKKRIYISDSKPINDKIIDVCIKLIESTTKKRRTKYWINKIGNKASGFKKIILKELSHKNILSITTKKYFWGIFTSHKYKLLNIQVAESIKSKLKKIVLENEKPDLESVLLLSLMNTCKLIRILFVSKSEYKAASKRIKELTQNIEISQAVSETLKEIQAAVAIAASSAFIGATSS